VKSSISVSAPGDNDSHMRIYCNSNEAGAKQLSASSNEATGTLMGGLCELRKSPGLWIALRRMRIVIDSLLSTPAHAR
jgi:hypothetical protein